VVFCTGYSDRALEVPQDALTATLSKPVELSHLRGCIESILQRRAGSVVHH
jgi:DNA-binding LytR/AlgR family response regulator